VILLSRLMEIFSGVVSFCLKTSIDKIVLELIIRYGHASLTNSG